MLLLLISFVAGILTALAPCVLPLLPVIVGGSIAQGNRWRTYTICVSLGLSVIIFTLLLKASTVLIAVPQGVWEWISGGILILFGILMVFPQLWDSLGFVNLMNRSSNRLLATGYQRNSLWGDAIMGAALGPVFSSCSPTYFVILATVLPASFGMGLLDLTAYAVGLSGFLFVIALAGEKLVQKLGVTIEPNGWFRRGIGVLFVVVGLGVATGAEASLEAYLLSRGLDITVVEQHLLGASQSDMRGANATSSAFLSPSMKASLYPSSPELASIDGYINTPGGKPVTLAQYKGKEVVLVDFWTYSCINCQRTIPYLNAWYEKYHDEGLEIVGVHTPEFAFEHVYANVQAAVQKFGINYPVVLDNEYGTWNAFGNSFWPRDYLIDIDGYIVYDHAGEGDYDGAEAAIQRALKERAQRLGMNTLISSTTTNPSNALSIDPTGVQSPETYFGAARNEFLGSGNQSQTGSQKLSIPQNISANTLYLDGVWNFQDEYAQNQATGAHIRYLYKAKNVYFVAASDTPVKIKVTRDGGKPLGDERGADVDANGEATIQADRLYDLVQGHDYSAHVLQIEIEGAGLQAYTFTFG